MFFAEIMGLLGSVDFPFVVRPSGPSRLDSGDQVAQDYVKHHMLRKVWASKDDTARLVVAGGRSTLRASMALP